MRVIALKLENYRNLKNDIILPCEGVNVICGDNAQGKTNLIEALWLFCGGHSFRPGKDSEVICWDKKNARLEMRFFGQEREQTAKLGFFPGKKTVEINGVEKRSAAALIEKFCAVVFSPEHLNLIKRGPGERRRFVDSAICREKLKNAVLLSKYNRLLSQRNSLLKDISKHPSLKKTLPIWDESLIKNGAALIKKRLEYIANLSESAKRYHSGISNSREELEIRYISTAGITADDDIAEVEKSAALSDEEMADYITGTFFKLNSDLYFFVYCCFAGVFRIIKIQVTENSLTYLGSASKDFENVKLSELDSSRRDYLLNELTGCQVFITCCEDSGMEQLRSGKIFNVRNGEISDVSALGSGYGDRGGNDNGNV